MHRRPWRRSFFSPLVLILSFLPLILFLCLSLLWVAFLGADVVPRVKRSADLPLRFRSDGSFKILQVADMHYGNGLVTRCRDVLPSESSRCTDINSTVFLKRMIEAEKPDLIAFTGDNIFGPSATDAAESLFKVFRPAMESRIPWAAILGNHDQESTMPRVELMSFISLMDYSVAQVNPSGFLVDGYGNYDIKVHGAWGSELANTSVLNLYFLDSGDRAMVGGQRTYGWIKDSQLAWLRTVSEELQSRYPAPSLSFFHIPIPDVRELWFKGFIGQFQEAIACQGLATLAFFGVGVNLVLFLTRVLQQNNAEAANNVSKWTGTVYIFSLAGAFLSDSYWGRYKTCAIFQVIFVIGLALLSLSTHLFLLKPSGCGDEDLNCGPHSSLQLGIFNLSVYLVALGNGGYQPNIATFGADQFDEEDYAESHSKISFFSYFYLALNLGSLFSNTFLDYFEDKGMWALGFWASAGSAMLALVLFLCGTTRYRHFKPNGNPLTRVCQVIVAASRKWRIRMLPSGEDLYEVEGKEVADSHANGSRKLLHTEGFKFLDRAAVIDPDDFITKNNQSSSRNPWCLCPITQVEELKCVLRLLPIWMTTIIYSVVFTQMASLFVEQGAAMKNNVGSFRIPPASMSAFDITSVALFILFYRRLLTPLISRWKKDRKGLTELQRMGVGLVIAIIAMISAGTVEVYRLKNVCSDCAYDSSVSILWQIPQYMLIGASEVFMYVGQLEFFNDQAPDGLKSFGSALCMTSISLGNYVSSLLVTIVMEITSKGNSPGWIPVNLNRGHMDRFYFLLASLTAADLLVFVACARWYKSIKLEGRYEDDEDNSNV